MLKIKTIKNHLPSIFIIFILSIILFYRNFLEDGQLLYVDMLFPNSLKRTYEFFSNAWFPYGSLSLIPLTIIRLPWILLTIVPAMILNVDIDHYLLFLFVFTFFLAGISSYIFTFYTLAMENREKEEDKKYNYRVVIGALISSLIYMYNPLSIGLLWAYGVYPFYALLPLISLLIIIALDKRKFNYIFVTSFLMMLATTYIHVIIWIIMILIFSFIYFTIRDFKPSKLFGNLRVVMTVIIIYLVMMSFWILPSILMYMKDSVEPPYNFKESMLDSFSEKSSIANSLRLVSGTRFFIHPEFIGLDIEEEKIPVIISSMNYDSIVNPSSVNDPLWNIFGYLIPILAFSSLVLYRNSYLKKIIYFFVILSIISIVLSLGTNSYFDFIYRWIALEAPWSNSFGWIFRAPYRFLIFGALGFSILSGYSIFRILNMGQKRNNYLTNLVCIFFVIGIIYFFAPIARAHSDYIFSPTKIPVEYDIANKWLDNQTGDFKTLWIPKFPSSGYFPSWAPSKRIGPINAVSSSKESFSNWFNRPIENYMNRLNASLEIGKMTAPIGIKYIILDNSMKKSYDIKNSLDNSSDIRFAFQYNFIYIYENINFVPSRIGIIERITRLDDNSQYILMYQKADNISISITDEEYLPKIEFIGNIPSTNIKSINYDRVNYGKYNIKIDTKDPFMLYFSETYNPLWYAKIDKVNGKSIKQVVRSTPLYSVVNSFWINQTGNVDITIEYEPQRWFYIGAIISFTMIVLCLIYLTYDWRKKKK